MKSKVIRKALRIQGKVLVLRDRHTKTPHCNFTYYGGYDLGYLEGQLSILIEIMDEDEYNQFVEQEKTLIKSFNNSKLRKLKRFKRKQKPKWEDE